MKQTRRSKYSAIKPIALQHIANGASASAVGRDLAIPAPTVRRWARQAGIEIQHQSHYPKVSMMDKHRVIYEMLMAGSYSVAQIAAQAGVCTTTVYNRRARLTTMNTRSRITPGDVSRVGTGRRLGLAERLLIADCLRAGHSHRRIAQIVCRSQSTISREIARNSVDGMYDAYHADQASGGRLARP
ncbi:helix-turn-helix domain-containing protein, partial [Corynebacterium amycolatum]|nr:helix-turn-helix domain-containing protein [Corynebacterium amycolatum]